jgi:hypothetical protein
MEYQMGVSIFSNQMNPEEVGNLIMNETQETKKKDLYK